MRDGAGANSGTKPDLADGPGPAVQGVGRLHAEVVQLLRAQVQVEGVAEPARNRTSCQRDQNYMNPGHRHPEHGKPDHRNLEHRGMDHRDLGNRSKGTQNPGTDLLMKPLLLLLLLLLVAPSGRLTPTQTTSRALIRRTGSAEPSDSYSSSEWSTEHQNRWKSADTRTETHSGSVSVQVS